MSYVPREGDIVRFAEAPQERKRNLPYEITATSPQYVWFRLRGEIHAYRKTPQELQAIGMTLYRSVDENDPVKGNDDNGS